MLGITTSWRENTWRFLVRRACLQIIVVVACWALLLPEPSFPDYKMTAWKILSTEMQFNLRTIYVRAIWHRNFLLLCLCSLQRSRATAERCAEPRMTHWAEAQVRLLKTINKPKGLCRLRAIGAALTVTRNIEQGIKQNKTWLKRWENWEFIAQTGSCVSIIRV